MKLKERECHAWPIGAWVRDRESKHWYSGLRSDGKGGVRFEPHSGEIVAQGHFGPFAAYQVRFGGSRGFVLEPECYSCQTIDDAKHAPYCSSLALRGVPHEPGFAPDWDEGDGNPSGDKRRVKGHKL